MHHVVLERWSRGNSPLHRLDPRAKLVPLVVFLVVTATAHNAAPEVFAALGALLAIAAAMARLPLGGVLARAALVLPFSVMFAIVSWLAGDPVRGMTLVARSYLSALAVLLVVATTPLPALLRGLELSGAPRFLLMVAQFLYRYLFVISEEAQHMRVAAASRGASASGLAAFRAAAGALAVLFARSYQRAEEIHRAMLARGFEGHFRSLVSVRFRAADAFFAASASLAPVLARAALERIV